MVLSHSLQRNPNLSIPSVKSNLKNEIQLQFAKNWWTGLSPAQCPGFDSQTQSLIALPLLNFSICDRQDILDYFNNTWTLTELLFSSLKTSEAFLRPPYHQLRHPLIFYYGHPAVLLLNKLRLAKLVDQSVDLYLEKVLETGVDEMSWDDMSKNEMEWPSIEEVKNYRQKIYNMTVDLIRHHPDLDRRENFNMNSKWWALFMSIEHEKIHFETSSVLIRELPLDLVESPKYWPSLGSSKLQGNVTNKKIENTFVPINGGELTYGKSETVPSYGWDNEYGVRTAQAKDFAVSKYLITNGEYYEFVASLAYTEDQYWSEEGLQWRKFRNSKRPSFWVAYGPEGLHDYKLRTIFSLLEMPWDWPAEVNYHEAEAYANWKTKTAKNKLQYRLLTEIEHHFLRDVDSDAVLQSKHYRETPQPSLKYNYNFQCSSPSSVLTATPSSKGVYDIYGNVWQWLQDQFNPLDNFKVHTLYDDFSTPCFDGKHQMIVGGSFISCGHEASKYARFHFRPHFFQHAGFRLAATLDGSKENGAVRLKQSSAYIHPQRESITDQMQRKNWWQEIKQPLEIASEELQSLWKLTVDEIINFEKTRNEKPPAGTALDVVTNDVKENFRIPYQGTKTFPERGESFDTLLKLISKDLQPSDQIPGHAGYMAYVAGAGNAISNMAQALSQTYNPYTAHFSLAPGLVSLELEVLKWLQNMIGYEEDKAGGFLTTGGSLANLSALSVARESCLQGYDLSVARFYTSKESHHSIAKALSILGFPLESLQTIDVDTEGRMQVAVLEQKITNDKKNALQPICVIATAGTTNTGAIDPLLSIAELCEKNNLWFHVDGAYGAFFKLTKDGSSKLQGIEKADSIVLDPHKSLSLPYGTGALLVKNKENLIYKHKGQTTYMPPSPLEGGLGRVDFADISPELSRDFRGLRIWLPIKTFGIQPFQLNLEEKLELTKYLYEELQKISAIVVAKVPDLTILNFRHKDATKTKALLHFINQSQKIYLTSCETRGEFTIRVCLLGFRSHYQHVNDLLQIIKEGLTKV